MGEWDVVKKEEIPEEWKAKSQSPIDRPISTITGKPLLTPQEKVAPVAESARGFSRAAFPASGDVLFTTLASRYIPQVGLPLKYGPRIASGSVKAANFLKRAVGSGLGSALGEFAGQKAFGEDTDFEKIKTEAILGPLGEAGFSAIAATTKGLMKAAKSLTVSGAATSEWIRNQVKRKTIDRAVEFITDLAPQSVKKAGAKIDIDDLGVSISRAFDETRKSYDLFGKHIDQMAKQNKYTEGYVALEETTQLLQDIRDRWVEGADEIFDLKRPIKQRSGFLGEKQTEFYAVTRRIPEGYDPRFHLSETKIVDGIEDIYGWKPGTKQNKILKGLVADDFIHPDDLKEFLAEFWKRGNKSDWMNLTPTQRTARKKLKDRIVKDIEKSSPEAAGLKETADKEFGAISNFKRIADIFNSPSSMKTMPSGDKYLNPTGLANSIYANEKMIRETMGDDIWIRMKSEADFYNKMAPNWRPPTATTARKIAGKMSPGAMTVTALAFTHPMLIPVTEAFGAMSAYSLLKLSDKKILKDISKYIVIPAAKTGLHMYGQPVLLPSH